MKASHPMNKRNSAMQKTAAPAPAREMSTLDRAKFAAMQMNNARETYNTYLNEITQRMMRMNEEFSRVTSYQTNEMQQAQSVISFVQEQQQNMRIDLIAKYASEIEKQRTAFDIYRSFLSADEQAEIDQFVARYNAE